MGHPGIILGDIRDGQGTVMALREYHQFDLKKTKVYGGELENGTHVEVEFGANRFVISLTVIPVTWQQIEAERKGPDEAIKRARREWIRQRSITALTYTGMGFVCAGFLSFLCAVCGVLSADGSGYPPWALYAAAGLLVGPIIGICFLGLSTLIERQEP